MLAVAFAAPAVASDPRLPDTGDATGILVAVGVWLGAAGAVATGIAAGRRRASNEV